MTHSDRFDVQTEPILDHVAELLSEAELRRRILDPFDRAAASISFSKGNVISSGQFSDRTAACVQRLYADAIGHNLNELQARDEVFVLLQETWPGGFQGAVLDAADRAQGGLAPILQHVARAAAVRFAHGYIRWALCRYIESCDWPARCRMAEILLRRIRKWLPPQLGRRNPALWADRVPRLLALATALDAFDHHGI